MILYFVNYYIMSLNCINIERKTEFKTNSVKTIFTGD